MWDLGAAVDLIWELQPRVRELGFHICLGGGVLNNGESAKDLDLFILPLHGQEDPNAYGVIESLTQVLTYKRALRDSPDYGPDQGWQSTQQFMFEYMGKRIDVFVIA